MANDDHKPQTLGGGEPAPDHDEPVARFPHPDRPEGERQDGAGAGHHRHDRSDAEPAGSTADRRTGSGADPLAAGAHGPAGEEPDAAHRGQPARFASGAASGSGAGAGGGGAGDVEEPETDSAGGGGRERGFADRRPPK